VASTLARIGALYRIEAQIRERGLTGAAKRVYRLAHAKPVINTFFVWAETQVARCPAAEQSVNSTLSD